MRHAWTRRDSHEPGQPIAPEATFCKPEEDPVLLLESTLRRTWIEPPYGEEEKALLEEEVTWRSCSASSESMSWRPSETHPLSCDRRWPSGHLLGAPCRTAVAGRSAACPAGCRRPAGMAADQQPPGMSRCNPPELLAVRHQLAGCPGLLVHAKSKQARSFHEHLWRLEAPDPWSAIAAKTETGEVLTVSRKGNMAAATTSADIH